MLCRVAGTVLEDLPPPSHHGAGQLQEFRSPANIPLAEGKFRVRNVSLSEGVVGSIVPGDSFCVFLFQPPLNDRLN